MMAGSITSQKSNNHLSYQSQENKSTFCLIKKSEFCNLPYMHIGVRGVFGEQVWQPLRQLPSYPTFPPPPDRQTAMLPCSPIWNFILHPRKCTLWSHWSISMDHDDSTNTSGWDLAHFRRRRENDHYAKPNLTVLSKALLTFFTRGLKTPPTSVRIEPTVTHSWD